MPIYIHRDGQQLGPYSVEQARDYLESGNLVADDLAWYDDAEDWVPLAQVPGVAAPIPAASAHSSAPDWVPPRRDTLPLEPEPAPRPVPVASTAPLVSALPAPIQRNPPPPPPNSTAQRGAPTRAGDDRNALRAAGIKNMTMGGLFFVGGSAVTAITYAATSENPHGGTYIMAWGTILFGGIQLVRGIIQFRKA
jgi:hypothetical protein